MKKINIFAFFVLLLSLVIPVTAHAYQCKQGNDGSDECWTRVQIGTGYTTLVSRGHILVASIAGVSVSNNDGFTARLSNASTDSAILGVAQGSIATGDAALILVRGRGVVKLEVPGATIASGDLIGVRASGTGAEVATLPASATPVATALEAGNTNSGVAEPNTSNIYAYIKV